MATLAINDVLEPVTEPPCLTSPVRILWIDRVLDRIVLMDLAEPPRQPWATALSEVDTWLSTGAAQRIQLRPPAYMLQTTLTEAAKVSRDKNWALIADLVDTGVPGAIFQEGAMAPMIIAHTKRIGREKDRKAIYRALYRYWMHGQVRDALLPNYGRCGAPGKQKVYREGKRAGRQPAHTADSDRPLLTLSDIDKSYIQIGFALYKNNKVKSIQDAYIKTLRRFYTLERKQTGLTDDDVTLKPLHELPTFRQFRYWGLRAFDDVAVLRARKGERKWQMNHRPLTGAAQDGVRGPCHRFEIDATIADIYLVSRYNRNWIMGRPVVYVVVDVFTAMIVGIFIGLEGPSWNGARQALYNAFSDKVAFCASLGIAIQPDDWPCHHLPQEVMADRGEMLGTAAEGIVSGLGITLATAPPFRPDWKAIVESRFRILNQTTQIHWMPGAVRERIRERGERDYRLDATLDLAEFTRIVVASLLHYNHHAHQPNRLTTGMIAESVEATPIARWNWGMSNGIGEAKSQSLESVHLHLLAREAGTIQAGGIGFKRMMYECHSPDAATWAARARHRGRTGIEVWHDPNSTGKIWVRGESGVFLPCTLRASDDRYRDRRYEEVIDMLAMIDQTSPDALHASLSSRVNLDAQIESTIQHATLAKDAVASGAPPTKSAKLANIRQYRQLERETQGMLPQHAKPAPAVEESSDAGSTAKNYAGARGAEVIDLLSRLRGQEGDT